MGFIGGGKSRPPSESKRQPSGLRLEASTWKNGLASPKGDLQICSEVGNSRGWDPYLWSVGSSSLTRGRTQVPLHWEHGVLSPGPPGKSLEGPLVGPGFQLFPVLPSVPACSESTSSSWFAWGGWRCSACRRPTWQDVCKAWELCGCSLWRTVPPRTRQEGCGMGCWGRDEFQAGAQPASGLVGLGRVLDIRLTTRVTGAIKCPCRGIF